MSEATQPKSENLEDKKMNTRIRKSKELDEIVLETVQSHPGYTMKQMQQLLSKGNMASEFDISFLTNSLARLKKGGKIFSQTLNDIVHGKVINTYFVGDSKDSSKQEYELRFKDKDLTSSINYLKEGPSKITAYAIDRDKIAIALDSHEYHINNSKFSNNLITKFNDNWIELKFPQDFVSFYDLEEGKFLFKIIPDKDTNSLILTRIANQASLQKESASTIKRILILEDDEDWAQELVEKLESGGYDADYAINVPKFKEKLEDEEPFDFISLDKKIIDEENDDVAGELFFEIKKQCPNAKVGILSRKIEPSEFEYYQKLGFVCLLLKRPRNRDRTSFNEVGDELLATLKVI